MKDARARGSRKSQAPDAPTARAAARVRSAGKWPYLPFLVFFLCSFILYNWIFDYVTVLARDTTYSFFLFDREFLGTFLDHPGGLVPYAGRFFAQFYHYAWLGALVVSGLVTCFSALFHLILKRVLRETSLFHTFFPGVLLLTAFSAFVMDVTIGLIASLGAFLIYLRLRRGAPRMIYTLLAIPGVYLIAGGYSWLFAIWVIASEWLGSRPSENLVPKLLYPALAAVVPLIAYRWLFVIPLRSAYLFPTVFVVMYSIDWTAAPTIALSAYLALMPFWARIPGRAQAATVATPGSKRRLIVEAALLAVLAVALAWNYDSAGSRHLAEFGQLYKHRQWDAILDKAARDPSNSLMSQFFTNCALYHKGRLLEEMFRYPQPWGARGLILNYAGTMPAGSPENDWEGAMYNCDLLYEMGHVNAAYVHILIHMGPGPTYENLERLADYYLLKGEYKAAETYLNVLDRTLFHRAFARRWKNLLADPDAADKYFAEPRSRMVTLELGTYFKNAVPPLGVPLSLLKSNPHNRMAFDYLAAWCMLNKSSLPVLADNLGYLRQAGYTRLPTHLQEALLVLEAATGAPVNLRGFKYDEAVRRRFDAFTEASSRFPNTEVAAQELVPSFGDTYMYYFALVETPPPFKSPGAYVRLGDEFRSDGMIEDAIAQYRYALRLDPRYSKAHASLADAVKSQGKLDEAAIHRAEEQRITEAPHASSENPEPFVPPRTE